MDLLLLRVGQLEKMPIKVLCDTGATQSFILDNVRPFSSESFTGNSVLLQGIELGTVQAPLHKIKLSSHIVSGSVVGGLRPFLPVKGISLILGNDIARGKVKANPCVSDDPSHDVSGPVDAVSGLFPACTVMHAMARRAPNQEDERDVGYYTRKSPLTCLHHHQVQTLRQCQLHTIRSSPTAMEQGKSKVMQNPVLSPQSLVEE